MGLSSCVFCNLPTETFKLSNNSFNVFFDRFPISLGHSLIIPKRHIDSFFDLNESEFTDLRSIIANTKNLLDQNYHPDGYNIGVNVGAEAGQTIFHLHIHVIPRYKGDQIDPRGGVRWIFPEKADYWTKAE